MTATKLDRATAALTSGQRYATRHVDAMALVKAGQVTP